MKRKLIVILTSIIYVSFLTFLSCSSSDSDKGGKAKISKSEDIKKEQEKLQKKKEIPDKEKSIEELLNDLKNNKKYTGSKYLIYFNDSIFFGYYTCNTTYDGDMAYFYYREQDGETIVQIYLKEGDVVKWRQL